MPQTIPLFQDYYLEATNAKAFNLFYQAHAEEVYRNGSEFQFPDRCLKPNGKM